MHVNSLIAILSKSEYGPYLGCAVRVSVDRQRAEGEKLPVCLPRREPVAKQLVIDRSRRRNKRQRACRESPLASPVLHSPSGQRLES